MVARTLAETSMTSAGNFRRRRLTRTNRPYRFVRQQNTGEFVGGQRTGPVAELGEADSFGLTGFALGKGFADANNGDEPGGQGGLGFLGDGFVGLGEVLAPL